MLIVLAVTKLPGQNMGDSVRWQPVPGGAMQAGRFLGWRGDSVRVRQFPEDRTIPRAYQLQVYHRKDAAGTLLINGLVGAGLFAGTAAILKPKDRAWGPGEGVLIGVGVGVIGGLIELMVSPGKWKSLP